MLLEELKEKVLQERNEMCKCPLCNQNIKDRKVTLYKGLIDALYQVYCWCGKNKCHEFRTKDIKHLLGKNEYARFGDLVRFGGIVYKPKDEYNQSHKAEFGLNMARAKSFFIGEYEIPVQITLNQITNEIIDSTYVKINDFPELSKLLDENGLYDYDIPASLF